LVTGCAASIFATLTAGVVSDLFPKAHQNISMSLNALAIMAGTGIGPLVSGAVVQHLG
jgi:MFS family permease